MTNLFLSEEREKHFRELYWEAVNKAVDDVLGAIVEGNIKNADEAHAWLDDDVAWIDYTEDNACWAIHTLLFSEHPSQGLADPDTLVDEVRYWTEGRPVADHKLKPADAFPFAIFAYQAFLADAKEILEANEKYKTLPLAGYRQDCG